MLPNSAHSGVQKFYAVTNDFVIGSGAMQGWRPTMEDSCAIIVALPQDPLTSLFGVFDGHGGNAISDFVSRNIYYYIISDPAFRIGAIKHALSNAFMRLDNLLMEDSTYSKIAGGSTAVIVLIRNTSLFCANLGDSRAVAYVKGEVIPLSRDHKPILRQERSRIVQAGCFIEYGRINGDLALSRAFGDFRFKKNKHKSMNEQAVISVPDVVEFILTKHWEFVVLACDGVWDSMTNEEVCTFVKQKISNNIQVDTICEQLLHKCLCKEFPTPESIGTDNMTIIIVVFLENASRPYLGKVLQGQRSYPINYIAP